MYSRLMNFEDLLLKIRLQSLARGKLAGLSGRVLIVRDAGDDAWLGLAAPEAALPPLPSSATQKSSGPSALTGNASSGNPQLTFRSVHDAMEAAVDGDEIVLMCGIHNGLGKSIHVDKRVLLRGQGRLGCTKIDHRANSPAFRITASAVVTGIEIDMTGFRECVLVSGDGRCRPIISNCIIRSSGDDTVNISGLCRPLFRACVMEGRKCGVKSFGSCEAILSVCTLSNCGGPGLRAMDRSSVKLDCCIVKGNKEDGIVAMDRSRVELNDTKVEDNKGTGVDISDSASVVMSHCDIASNIGGVWLWQQGKIMGKENRLDGGASYVIMTETPETRSQLEHCSIIGDVVAHDDLKEYLRAQNSMQPSQNPAYFPPEDGPFVFHPRQC